jgi:hypothetical protein
VTFFAHFAAVGDDSDGFQNPANPAVVDGEGFDPEFGDSRSGILVFSKEDDKVRFKAHKHLVIDIKVTADSRFCGCFRRKIAITGYSHNALSQIQFIKNFGDAGSEGDDSGRLRLLRFDTGTRRL